MPDGLNKWKNPNGSCDLGDISDQVVILQDFFHASTFPPVFFTSRDQSMVGLWPRLVGATTRPFPNEWDSHLLVGMQLFF